jgi:glycosyltransferase involved in cell wall biosynthesis
MISVAPSRSRSAGIAPGIAPADGPGVGYVMMAYARVDDAFITNEIYLLERMGLKLHVFSVKQPVDNARRHASVEQIQATVTSLPDLTTSRNRRALWRHVRAYWKSHLALLLRRPLRYLGTMSYALGLHFRYRVPLRGKRVTEEQFLVDFLRAGPVALHVVERPWIRHLHGHFCHASTTVTMMASRLAGVSYSFTAHAKDMYLAKFNPGDLLQQKAKGAEFVVTCTEQNRAHMQRLCPDVTSLHRIYHGIDTAVFTPRAPRPTPNGHLPRILAVGRFVETKGFPYLVRACRLLREQGYAFRCDIIGRTDKDSELVRQLIAEGRLEANVFVTDALTHDEIKRLYEESAILCAPCIVARDGDRDGIPNVLVEAMAMGLPVVSTPVSAIPELVQDGTNGLLVPQRDVEALAAALARLIDDPALRARLGDAGRETVRDAFDAERTTTQLKDLFASCLNGGARR